MKRFTDVLTTFAFLRAKQIEFGIQSLIDDYALSPLPETIEEHEAAQRSDYPLALIQRALLLSSHILTRHPNQLPTQLLGRLLSFEGRDIGKLLEGARAWNDVAWLRPITGSLADYGTWLARTLYTQARSVEAVAITPDGANIISGSSDGVLGVWDLEHGLLLDSLSGYEHQVGPVAISPDGKIVIGAAFNEITAWDLDRRFVLWKVVTDLLGFYSLAFTQCGTRLIAGSHTGLIKIWDAGTGKETGTLVGHTHPVFGLTAIPNTDWIISAATDSTLKIWDLASSKELRTLKGHAAGVTAVAVLSNGKRAVSASIDGTLKLWDLESGSDLLTLVGHNDWVNSVAVTNDDSKAISASSDGTLKVWDLQTGTELLTLAGHNSFVNDVAARPDGHQVVSASTDGTIKVWNIDLPHSNSTAPSTSADKHDGSVNDIKLLSNNTLALSASSDTTLKLWDLSSGTVLRTFRGHTQSVKLVVVNSSGTKAISASDDGTAKVWNITNGDELHTLGGHDEEIRDIALVPRRRKNTRHPLMKAGEFVQAVWEWLMMRKLETSNVNLVITASPLTLKVWNLDTGEELHTFQVRNSRPSIGVTTDGRQTISCTARHRTERGWILKIWDNLTGDEVGILQGLGDSGVVTTNIKNSIAVSGDGSRVIAAADDRTIKVWNLASGELIHNMSCQRDRLTLLTSLVGEVVLSGSMDGHCRVWDVGRGVQLYESWNHQQAITSGQISSDGHSAVTTSADGHLRLWDIYTGKTIADFTPDVTLLCCDVTSDTSLIVAGDRTGLVHVLRLEKCNSN